MPDVNPSLLELMGVPPQPLVITRPKDDHYRSPPKCVRALLSVERVTGPVWEPCAGDGIMAAALADEIGADQVTATTLHHEGRWWHPVTTGIDVLSVTKPLAPVIITNPPYSKLGGRTLRNAGAATAIIAHLLALLAATDDSGAMLCCLLDVRYRLSDVRNKPGGLLHEFPPHTIHAFRNRVTMYPPTVGADDTLSSGTMPFGWFVWRHPFRRPGADTVLRTTLNSRDFERPDDRVRFDLPRIGDRRRARKEGGTS